MSRFWLAFSVADDRVADFGYLGPWWSVDVPGPDSTIGAAVVAESVEAAEALIRESFSGEPPPLTFSVRDRKPDSWSPFRARFPRAPWMQWEGE